MREFGARTLSAYLRDEAMLKGNNKHKTKIVWNEHWKVSQTPRNMFTEYQL